jgi:hypothetical protein
MSLPPSFIVWVVAAGTLLPPCLSLSSQARLEYSPRHKAQTQVGQGYSITLGSKNEAQEEWGSPVAGLKTRFAREGASLSGLFHGVGPSLLNRT